MSLAAGFYLVGVFASTFIITLFIFRFLDQLVAEVRLRDRLLRLFFASANGALAVFAMILHYGMIPSAFLVLVLDTCYVLEYILMSKDNVPSYLFFGSAVFFNNFMVYVLVYAAFRFFSFGTLPLDVYQRTVFIVANVLCIGIIILYRLPAFPTKEVKGIIHSPENRLLNIWFPGVSSVTFLDVILILPAMEGAWANRSEWMSHGREIAFYVIVAEWALLLMSSSYLIVYYQAGRLGVRDKFQNVKEQADRQPLTGLLNRRAWEQRVREDLASDIKGYLVMLDLDHFKEVNDNLGHLEGDRILKETADMLRQAFRKIDLIGHIGGDEFCVFIPGNFEKETLDRRLEELMALRRTEFRAKNGETFCLSFSGGYTAVPEKAASLEELILEADKALYWQKEHGRNGFAMYREDM